MVDPALQQRRGVTGVEGFKRIVRHNLSFAPDSRSEIETLVAEAEHVAE